MPTPIIHEKTAELRELLRHYDAAHALARPTYARAIAEGCITAIAELWHVHDRLAARVDALEHFPELRQR